MKCKHIPVFRALLGLLAIVLLMGFQTVQSQVHHDATSLEMAGLHHYGVEKGRIRFEYSGSKTGSEIIVFKSWGWEERRIEDSRFNALGMNQASSNEFYRNGNLVLSRPKSGRLASKSPDRHLSKVLATDPDSTQNPLALAALLDKEEVRRVGEDRILGKPCTIYELPKESRKVWVWEGIVLRSVQEWLGERIVLEATSIDLEYAPDVEEVTLPGNVEVR